MRRLALSILLVGAAGLAACAAEPVAPPAGVAAGGHVCGTGSIDADGDGAVTAAEWNAWRASGFAAWDLNHDNRIDRTEFQNCYTAGGFYPTAYYNPDYWTNYWSAFDVNGDGYLSADEYWSAQAWASVDRNHNGIIDSSEWVWWPH
jgi:hypothetical protein